MMEDKDVPLSKQHKGANVDDMFRVGVAVTELPFLPGRFQKPISTSSSSVLALLSEPVSIDTPSQQDSVNAASENGDRASLYSLSVTNGKDTTSDAADVHETAPDAICSGDDVSALLDYSRITTLEQGLSEVGALENTKQ